MNEFIENIIKPETELERQIISDPDFIKGAYWGKIRNGHPEGLVIYHIRDILANIDNLNDITENDRKKLRLIAIIHDTFKYQVNQKLPKSGENHHGRIAARFANKYIDDQSILNIISWHDDAYNAWSVGNRHNNWDKAENRALTLIESLENLNCVELYLAFYQCDNSTGNKTGDDFYWFEELTHN